MTKWIRSLVVVGALCGMTLGPCSEAHAALNAYLKLKRPGGIAGSDLLKGNGALAVLDVEQGIVSPRDSESGIEEAEPRNKPLVLTRPVDAAAPELYRAMRRGELLSEVELVVFAPEDRAQTTPLYAVKLKHAKISRIELVQDAKSGGVAMQISLQFQRLERTAPTGAPIVRMDDWEAPNGKK